MLTHCVQEHMNECAPRGNIKYPTQFNPGALARSAGPVYRCAPPCLTHRNRQWAIQSTAHPRAAQRAVCAYGTTGTLNPCIVDGATILQINSGSDLAALATVWYIPVPG